MRKKANWIFAMMLILALIFVGVSCRQATVIETTALETEAAEATALETESSEAAAPGEPITINFWCLAGPTLTWVNEWKAMYEAEFPNVTINVTSHEQNAIMDLMTSALAGGSEDVDIAWYWPGAAIDTWAREGFLLDLTPYYDQYGWWDKKNVGAQNYITEGSGMFTFTTDWVTVPHYFYNTKIFQEVGIEPPKTIDEIFVMADKIKAAGYGVWSAGVVDRWPIGGIFNDYLADTMAPEDFKKLVNWERDPNKSAETAEIYLNDSVVKSWEFIKSLIDAGIFVDGANAMDDTAARQAFENSKTAIYDSGSWTMPIFASEAPDLVYDYFNLPPLDGRLTICSGYNGVSVPASISEEKLAVVLDILDHSFKKDYSAAIFGVGAFPDNITLTDDELAELATDPFSIRIIQDVKKYGDVGIIDALQSPALRQNYYEIIGDFFDGKITPQEASQRLYDGAVEILE